LEGEFIAMSERNVFDVGVRLIGGREWVHVRDGNSKVMKRNEIKKRGDKQKSEPEECSKPLMKCKSSRGM
jgi:hypothetical protein